MARAAERSTVRWRGPARPRSPAGRGCRRRSIPRTDRSAPAGRIDGADPRYAATTPTISTAGAAMMTATQPETRSSCIRLILHDLDEANLKRFQSACRVTQPQRRQKPSARLWRASSYPGRRRSGLSPTCRYSWTVHQTSQADRPGGQDSRRAVSALMLSAAVAPSPTPCLHLALEHGDLAAAVAGDGVDPEPGGYRPRRLGGQVADHRGSFPEPAHVGGQHRDQAPAKPSTCPTGVPIAISVTHGSRERPQRCEGSHAPLTVSSLPLAHHRIAGQGVGRKRRWTQLAATATGRVPLPGYAHAGVCCAGGGARDRG